MKKIFVTRKGLQVLEARRLELMEKLKIIQGQKGLAIADGTWHDNFAFEQLTREEDALSKQLRNQREILDAVTIVPDVPSGTETLQIGHVASLSIDGDEMKTFVVGSFGETDLKAIPPVIDYGAPLLEPFYGHEEGHEAVINLEGVSKNVVLESIKMRSD